MIIFRNIEKENKQLTEPRFQTSKESGEKAFSPVSMQLTNIYYGMLLGLLTVAGIFVNPRTASSQQPEGFRPACLRQIGKLRNLYEIDSGIYRSAQPRRHSYSAIKRAGIKEILNLRRHTNKDSSRGSQSGLILVQIPLKARDLDAGHIVEALRIIRDRNGPILIHCWKGSDRTGLLCAMYRIIFDHWSREDALQEMEHGGFGFHKTYREIPAYIRQADIDSIRRVLARP